MKSPGPAKVVHPRANRLSAGAREATVRPILIKQPVNPAPTVHGFASTGIPAGQQVASLVVFTVVAALGVLIPLALYLGAGERATATLESWKTWAAANHATVTAVIFAVIGLKLLGDGVGIITR